jgi:membrane protein
MHGIGSVSGGGTEEERACESAVTRRVRSFSIRVEVSGLPASQTRWLHRFRYAVVAAVRGYSRHGASQQAAAIAFRVLFSLVPLIALLVAIVDLVIPETARERVVEWVVGSLSGSTGLEESVQRALNQGPAAASIAGLVALGGLIWAASGMMGAIRRAFQAIWESGPRHSYVRGKIVDLVVVLGTGIAVIVGFGLSIVVDAVYEVGSHIGAAVGVESAGGWLGAAATGAARLGLVFACLAALYRVLPTTAPRWEALWPGAAVGAVGFQLATTVYSAYLARFGDLSVVYGSLGALLGFLLVVWAGAIAMLIGAEIVAGWPDTDDARAHDQVGPIDRSGE